jgi:hypothetical protein
MTVFVHCATDRKHKAMRIGKYCRSENAEGRACGICLPASTKIVVAAIRSRKNKSAVFSAIAGSFLKSPFCFGYHRIWLKGGNIILDAALR